MKKPAANSLISLATALIILLVAGGFLWCL